MNDTAWICVLFSWLFFFHCNRNWHRVNAREWGHVASFHTGFRSNRCDSLKGALLNIPTYTLFNYSIILVLWHLLLSAGKKGRYPSTVKQFTLTGFPFLPQSVHVDTGSNPGGWCLTWESELLSSMDVSCTPCRE